MLKEVDERGNTKGEDMVEEAIINLLLLAALVLLLEVEVLSVELDVVVDVVFLLGPALTPTLVELLLVPLFCHNKALNGLALAPLLITPP